MAQQGSGSAREQCRRLLGERDLQRRPEKIDAAVHPAQATFRHAVLDRIGTQPGGQQLCPRDHTVLRLCHADGAPVRGLPLRGADNFPLPRVTRNCGSYSAYTADNIPRFRTVQGEGTLSGVTAGHDPTLTSHDPLMNHGL